MSRHTSDSSPPIAALATPPGRGGLAVVRVSGRELLPALLPLLRGKGRRPMESTALEPGRLRLVTLVEPGGEQILDQLLVVFFRAPHSFTGEDVVEFHCHGSPLLVEQLLTVLGQVGIALAAPGEFSRRAFINGRMDLIQAEALQRMIHSTTLRGVRASARLLEGDLSRLLQTVRSELILLLAHVEAGIDFADEEISPDSLERMAMRLHPLLELLRPWQRHGALAMRVQQGAQVTLVGRPNAGKSSLFNRLTGMDRAIVSPVPGTTRDFIEVTLEMNGIPVKLVDTAGLRDSLDPVEQEGVRRTHQQVALSDLVLLVVDAACGLGAEELALLSTLGERSALLVWNKIDQAPEALPLAAVGLPPLFPVSCLEGRGLEALHERMVFELSLVAELDGDGAFLVSSRQVRAVGALLTAMEAARQRCLSGVLPEVLAMELREALSAVGELTGEVTHDEMLDALFSTFCVGK